MKIKLALFLAYGMGLSAVHAAVVDDLACTLEMKGAAGFPALVTSLPARGVRQPEANTEPNSVFTSAEVKISQRVYGETKHDGQVDVRVFYRHAIRLDDKGQPIDAFHWRCVEMFLTIDGEKFDLSCPEAPKDPFHDETKAWQSVRLVNGVPQFAVREFLFDVSASPMGPIQLHCKRLGTLP